MRNRVITVLLVLSVFFQSHLCVATDNFWMDNPDLLHYLEAVTKIRENFLFSEPDVRRSQIIRDTITAYLKRKDPFSDYLSPEEYSAFKDSQKNDYAGIGMEIQKNDTEEVICYPYPDTPAHKAGIEIGDRLEAIDSISVEGKSLYTLAAMAKGKKGTYLELTIRKKSRISKNLLIKRQPISVKAVSRQEVDGMPVIRIYGFAASVCQDLKFLLSAFEKDQPVIIDLRANPGGNFHAAVDAAMLFLDKGKTVVSVRNQKQVVKAYTSFTSSLMPDSKIFLWQDEKTASAAEVFIAALTQNQRAVSIGKRSFGKGTRQDIIELTDGSALVLTTGYLQTPDKRIYHGKGLEPDHVLTETNPDTSDYMKVNKALLREH